MQCYYDEYSAMLLTQVCNLTFGEGLLMASVSKVFLDKTMPNLRPTRECKQSLCGKNALSSLCLVEDCIPTGIKHRSICFLKDKNSINVSNK